MYDPLVSVIVITYNQEKFISDTIKSILMQKTDFIVELIISNDNSQDNTHEIINSLIKTKSKNFIINYINHNENIGMMKNFLKAINLARGKYIAICEGDDYWTNENKLQKQVNFLEKNQDFSICFHKVHLKYEDGVKMIYPDINKDTTQITCLSDIVKKNYIHTPSVIFRNQKPYPNWLINVYPGDYPLHIINACTGKMMMFSEKMAVYRIHNGGVDSTKKFNTSKTLNFGLLMSKYLNNKGFKKEAQIIRKNFVEQYCITYAIDNVESFSRFKRFLIMIRYGNNLQKILSILPLLFGKYTSVMYFKFLSFK